MLLDPSYGDLGQARPPTLEMKTGPLDRESLRSWPSPRSYRDNILPAGGGDISPPPP